MKKTAIFHSKLAHGHDLHQCHQVGIQYPGATASKGFSRNQTDKSTTNADFTDFPDARVKEISSIEEGKFNLNWAYRAISNLKRELRKYRMGTE